MKKIALLGASIGVIGVFAVSPAASMAATCHGPTSQARNSDGDVTGADTVQVMPDGGIVYSDKASYLGVIGPQGFLEGSFNGSDLTIQGAATNAPVEGKGSVGTGGAKLCVNGMPIL